MAEQSKIEKAAELITLHSEEWSVPGSGQWRCGCGFDFGKNDELFEDRQRLHQVEVLYRSGVLGD